MERRACGHRRAMRWRGAWAFLVLASCGKLAANDAVNGTDDAPSKNADGGVLPQDSGSFAAPVDAAIPFTPIDTSSWPAAAGDAACAFDVRFSGENTPTFHVSGQRVSASLEGTEIPYVGFGCSGEIGGASYTFLGGTLSYQESVEPQWAYVYTANDEFFVAGEQVATACDLEETDDAFPTIGSNVSGSFSCTYLPGTEGAITISNGTFGTTLSNAKLDIPYR